MRDKIEQIITTVPPKLRFQLTVLERVEDWVAYTNNLIQLGFKVSGAWRLSWGERLYYIVPMYLGPADYAVDIMVRVEKRDEKTMAEYYIQNVLRTFIRDKGFDEFLKEIMRWLS